MRDKKKYTDKIRFLTKKNIIDKKKKYSISTINRLYSFYKRNPLDTPLYEAYGLSKRIDNYIDTYEGDFTVTTPKGRINYKEYIVKKANKRYDNINKKIHYQATFKAGSYKRYVKRIQDYLVYRYNINCNENNINNVINNFEKNNIQLIKKDVYTIYGNLKDFYRSMLIGSIATFKSEDFTQGEGYNYQRTGFVRIYPGRERKYINFFISGILESVIQGFLIVKQYDKMNITLKKIEIVFTSDLKASKYEKLRI